MDNVWMVLVLSLLPGAGNFAGGMVAEFWKTSPRLLNWALHAAAGVVIAVVSVELMPQALGSLAGWWIALAFACGGGAYILLESAVERLQQRGEGDDRSRMWMIYSAVAIDLVSDGLMIGTGAVVSSGLAIVLAAGQVLADIPEGYATMANFQDKDIPRKKRILFSASFFIYSTAAALAAYFLLRSAPQNLTLAMLVFVAGMLTVAAVEDMLAEAHESKEDNRRSVVAFVGGFTLFTLVSAGLESLQLGL
jgi:ZIP family zinc transporter